MKKGLTASLGILLIAFITAIAIVTVPKIIKQVYPSEEKAEVRPKVLIDILYAGQNNTKLEVIVRANTFGMGSIGVEYFNMSSGKKEVKFYKLKVKEGKNKELLELGENISVVKVFSLYYSDPKYKEFHLAEEEGPGISFEGYSDYAVLDCDPDNVTIYVEDDSRIHSVDIYLNGNLVSSASNINQTTYNTTVAVCSECPGTDTIKVIAKDIYGNENTEIHYVNCVYKELVSLVWYRTYPSNGAGQAQAICSDGTYLYVAGNILEAPDRLCPCYSIVILKMNKTTGEILDSKIFEPVDGIANNDSDHISDCYILGDYLYVSTFNPHEFIEKIDLSNLSIVAEFNMTEKGDVAPYWIESDGIYLYVGSVGKVLKMDTNGNPILLVKYNITNNGTIIELNYTDYQTNTTYSENISVDICPNGTTSSHIDYVWKGKYYNGYVYVPGSYFCSGDYDGDEEAETESGIFIFKFNETLGLVDYYFKNWKYIDDGWEGITDLDFDMQHIYTLEIVRYNNYADIYVDKLNLTDFQEINSKKIKTVSSEDWYAWFLNVDGDYVVAVHSDTPLEAFILDRNLTILENKTVTADSNRWDNYFWGEMFSEYPYFYIPAENISDPNNKTMAIYAYIFNI